jgi:hypothetical protein
LSDELNIRRIAVKFVPRLLSSDQKEYRIAIYIELKKQPEKEPNFISNIITSGESWVLVYDR